MAKPTARLMNCLGLHSNSGSWAQISSDFDTQNRPQNIRCHYFHIMCPFEHGNILTQEHFVDSTEDPQEVSYTGPQSLGGVVMNFPHPVTIVIPRPLPTPGCVAHRGVAAADGSHRRLRLLPPARLRGAVRQRLRRRVAGRLGAPHPRLGRRTGATRRRMHRGPRRGASTPRRVRPLRQRREGARAGGRAVADRPAYPASCSSVSANVPAATFMTVCASARTSGSTASA